jgi:hypothetical protein
VISENVPNGHVTILNYKSAGLDFVYTIGSRESLFRPYIKAGANYIIEKRIIDQYRLSDGVLMPANEISSDPALVPSAGFGFKLSLTKNLSLKSGVDGWTSKPVNQEPVTLDFAGRLGLSWMF